MKKKLVILLTAVLAAGMVIGCGNGDSKTEEKSGEEAQSGEAADQGEAGGSVAFLKDIKVEDYVTLGEYKGMEVTVTSAGVDESELDSLVEQVYFSSITAENGGVIDRAVEDGDTVYIDYEGKKDGVAFEGGTDSNSPLTIGSNRFIEGFEAGLIGVMPGETVDLNLAFPEEYKNNAELAGQEVVFTVTVNYILPTEMKDEVVAAWGDEEYSTVEELRQYAYDYLEESIAYEYEVNLENAVLSQFMDNCVFQEMPQNILTQYENNMRANIESAAAAYDVDADTYAYYYYNTTLDGFVETYLEDSVKQSMAFQAVANAENLNVGDEELDEMLLEYALSSGYSSVEEYIDVEQRESYREYFMFDKVISYLIDNAIISS